MEYLADIPGTLRDLIVAGIVYFAFKTAKDADLTKLVVIWRGFLWCASIALFAALTMGSPSCETGGDPLFGGCDQYADDGYAASTLQRGQRFLSFLTLLWVPVIVGALNAKYRPKRRTAEGRSAEFLRIDQPQP